MKHVTHDTVRLLFPLSEEQRAALATAGYTADDTANWGAFYRALHSCPYDNVTPSVRKTMSQRAALFWCITQVWVLVLIIIGICWFIWGRT